MQNLSKRQLLSVLQKPALPVSNKNNEKQLISNP